MSVNPEWVRAAAAAAIDPTKLDAGQLYELYGKLLRATEGLRKDGLSVEQAIRTLTRDQRLALKESVFGVLAFPKRKEESNATS